MNRRPREDVLVRRTVMVEAIPSGAPIELQAGQLAQITQALGGSFTLAVEGQLVRLKGQDADAIGKQPPAALDIPAGKAVELKPGGYHIMLMNLQQQVKAGDDIPLALVFEDKDGKRTTVKLSCVCSSSAKRIACAPAFGCASSN